MTEELKLKLFESIDIAARMMIHSRHLIESDQLIEDQFLHSYWVYSRDLANQWMKSLVVCEKVLGQGNAIRSRQCWLEYEPELREIIRADVLHRAWYTILHASDVRLGKCHAEPIGLSALCHQTQARTRALKLILLGYQFDASRMKKLNQIRKNAESWSDLICSHLATTSQAQNVFFDRKRAEQWGNKPLGVLLPTLKLSFLSSRDAVLNWELIAGSDEKNLMNPLQKLSKVMLDCFPPSTFDANGMLKHWQ